MFDLQGRTGREGVIVDQVTEDGQRHQKQEKLRHCVYTKLCGVCKAPSLSILMCLYAVRNRFCECLCVRLCKCATAFVHEICSKEYKSVHAHLSRLLPKVFPITNIQSNDLIRCKLIAHLLTSPA